MKASLRARTSSMMVVLPLLLQGPVPAVAQPCGARVTVRQIGMTTNEDGTRTLRYRASVQTDQSACTKVTFTIIRSYIKPDGAAVEDAIPVQVQVPGRAIDVEGETLANTRRLIYWRADRVSCQPCGDQATGVPAAPVPAASSRPVPTTAPPAETDDRAARGSSGPKLGKKAALIGGGAAIVATGAFVALGGSGSGAAPADGGKSGTPTARPTVAPTTPPLSPVATPTPTPAGATPTATPVPGGSPTATPVVGSTPTATPAPTSTPSSGGTVRVLPGAPPAAPAGTAEGSMDLLDTDPPGGNTITAARSSVSTRFQVYIEEAGSDLRLEVQFWSGGQMCIRDVSSPLAIKAKEPIIVQMPVANVRQCTAPFRTTLVRAYLNDRSTPKLVQDFPLGFDFVP